MDTKTLILDTAEQLFAEHGFDATSVRDITQAANVNLGAINYHFKTKDALILAVFTRRLTPLNEVRLAQLDAIETATKDGPLPLDAVLDAFIRPMVELDGKADSGGGFFRLLGRCFLEPGDALAKLLAGEFRELVQRFSVALLRSVPTMPPEQLFWKMSFMFGSVHHSLDTWLRFETNPFTNLAGVAKAAPLSREQLVQHLVAYSAAGFSTSQPI